MKWLNGIEITELETSHLNNILTWIMKQEFKFTRTVRRGGGSPPDCWYEEYEEDVDLNPHYSAVRNELERRRIMGIEK